MKRVFSRPIFTIQNYEQAIYLTEVLHSFDSAPGGIGRHICTGDQAIGGG
jgi:hypothetical protein